MKGIRKTSLLRQIAYTLHRNSERCLFGLILLFPLTQSFGSSPLSKSLITLLISATCLAVYAIRSKSRWLRENRFLRAPWGLSSAGMLCLSMLFLSEAFPESCLFVITVVMVGQLIFVEMRNRRFMAWARVSRRRNQHIRWQRQRTLLQAQLSEGLQWISALQHDIRQPLQALGLLLSSPRIQRDPSFESLVKQLQGCHQWIYELSENATEVAAIQANKRPLVSLRPTDAYAVVASFSSWCQPLATSKGLQVFLTLPAEASMLMLTTDERKLKRVLANLIHNALRYTDNGKVNIALLISPDSLTFQVTDSGPGLPPHIRGMLENLTLPDPGKGGLHRGLGLFVVVGFCKQMRWKVSIPKTDSTGTCIELTVPLTKATQTQIDNLTLA